MSNGTRGLVFHHHRVVHAVRRVVHQVEAPHLVLQKVFRPVLRAEVHLLVQAVYHQVALRAEVHHPVVLRAEVHHLVVLRAEVHHPVALHLFFYL